MPPHARVLVAHQAEQVRARFTSALTEARHLALPASSEREVRRVTSDVADPLSLVLLDLALGHDPLALVRDLSRRTPRPLPVMVFAGSVTSAAEVLPLVALAVTFINEHAPADHIAAAVAPHLFPDSFNRRTSDRIAIGLPVAFRVGQTSATAVTLDIARHGVAIRTMSPLPRETAVQVRFTLPGSGGVEAGGRVIWSDTQVGMGVVFEEMTPATQRTIEAFLEARQARRVSGRAAT